MTALSSSTVTPKLLCHSGAYVDLQNPAPETFSIADVAHGLSNICRFNGQGRSYTVAEHSVLASQIVDPAFAWDALLHDAHEAYIGDVTAPLKRLLPDYRALEARFEIAVAARFSLRLPRLHEVRRADMQMLKIEQRIVMDNGDPWLELEGVEEPDVLIEFLTPAEAKARFFARYFELGGVA